MHQVVNKGGSSKSQQQLPQPGNGKTRSNAGYASQHHSNRNGQKAANSSKMKQPKNDSSDEDELHEEPPDMRVYPEFLKNLPGVQASDSMGYRIEALRVYIET